MSQPPRLRLQRAGRLADAALTMDQHKRFGAPDAYGYALLAVIEVERGAETASDEAIRRRFSTTRTTSAYRPPKPTLPSGATHLRARELSAGLAKDAGPRPEVNCFLQRPRQPPEPLRGQPQILPAGAPRRAHELRNVHRLGEPVHRPRSDGEPGAQGCGRPTRAPPRMLFEAALTARENSHGADRPRDRGRFSRGSPPTPSAAPKPPSPPRRRTPPPTTPSPPLRPTSATGFPSPRAERRPRSTGSSKAWAFRTPSTSGGTSRPVAVPRC